MINLGGLLKLFKLKAKYKIYKFIVRYLRKISIKNVDFT